MLYLQGIELTNCLLGFNGWSCEIVKIQAQKIQAQKTTDSDPQRRDIHQGTCTCTCTVRVTLKDGQTAEGTASVSADSISSSKKRAVTEARKIALGGLNVVMQQGPQKKRKMCVSLDPTTHPIHVNVNGTSKQDT